MHHTSFARGRPCALAPAALLLLALCLLAGGAQALNESMNTSAIVPDPSLLAAGSESSAAASGYETPIVVRAADQVDPAIYGTRVIWQDWRNDDWYPGKIGFESDGDIYSYDLVSHLELPEGASASDYGKFLPNDYDPVISGAGIFWVWAGFSDATIQNTINGRTLAGAPVNVTTLGDLNYRPVSDLAVDGDSLVYVLDELSLIAFNTTTGESRTIRQNIDGLRAPDISGGSIVWQENDGTGWNIYWYNPAGGSVRALANASGDQVSPAIDGTRVVWADNRSGDWDLYAADLSQPDPAGVPWLVAPGDQTNPQLSGDRVVWQDNRNGAWQIWLGSLSGGAVGPVSPASGDQEAPAVDGDRIVWQDNRNGTWDVYMFTVSSSAPIPVPTPAPLVITSPGTYSVAADGFDGTVTPIEIRSSDVVLDGTGRTIDGAGRPGSCGIRIAGPVSNVVVRNVRLVNWETGICADAVTDSVIETSEIAHNFRGIALNDTRDIEVRNNDLSFNDITGVAVTDAVNATIRANDVLRTGDGFELSYYGGGFEEMYIHALEVTGSTGTGIVDNDLGGDHGSINLRHSDSTRVTGNQITGRHCGILSLSTVQGSANDAVVVNNVFRNWKALYGSLPNATWNTTPSPGPNVVGGPSIGGNFWANPEGTGFSETHPDANGDGFIDTPFDNDWGGTDYLPLAVWNGSGPGPAPYRPFLVPGRTQAEDYNLGGEGVAYHDTTAGNSGGAYRQDDVDIETAGGVTNVGWIRNGEYLTYTATVAQAGTYTMTVRVASPNTGRSMALSVDGAPAATLAVPNTGSFATFRDVGVPVTLAAGTHVFRLTFAGDGQNLDWIEFGPVSTPPVQPNGTPYKPLAIPGTIQAEDYNLGGEGVAYHDTTAGNSGGAYRQDGVDIETAGGVTNVGWIRNGEYLTYTATVAQAGTYTMTARAASPNTGRTIAVSVDGAPMTTISVPNTGSFATFKTVSVPVTLAAGSHTLKLAFSGDGQNLDWVAFGTGPVVTTPPTTPAAGVASFTAAPLTAPHGTAVKFTLTPATGKSIGSAWWSFDAPAHLNTWNSRAINPTFFYPSAGTFSPLVKITYADGSIETVQRTGYIRAT